MLHIWLTEQKGKIGIMSCEFFIGETLISFFDVKLSF